MLSAPLIQNAKQWVSQRRYRVLGGVLLVVIIWLLFFRGSETQYQTLTVHRGNFSQQISVSGTVVASDDVSLGFSQGGRIAYSPYKVGDMVGAGTVIAEIENGDMRALVTQKRATLLARQANLNALKAGTRPEQIAVTQSQIESDKTTLNQANLSLLLAIQSAYTAADDAVRNTADQFISSPRSSNPTLSFSTSNSQAQYRLLNGRVAAEAMLASWNAAANALTPTDDLASVTLTAQQNLAKVATLLSDANSALNSAIPSANVPSETIATYVTAVAGARTAIDTAATALTAAQTARASAANTLNKDEKSLALEQAGAAEEDIEAAEADVAAAQADVDSAQAQLRKTQVVAPFSGQITKMDAKVGSIAGANAELIAIISKNTPQIESYVPEVDIAAVAVGNSASTTLDAYGAATTFAASVVSIDPAQTVRGGVSTYKTTLTFLKNDSRIKPGMTAAVTIATGIVPDAIIVPKGAIFTKNGIDTIELLVNEKVVEVSVITQPTSLGSVVVTSGLKDGDAVILNPEAQ